MTNIDIHNVASIEVGDKREGRCTTHDYNVRTITVTKENGEMLTLTLFADESFKLVMRGDRL